MASDNLNEVGKVLRETKERADFAAKKVRPNRPSIERTRDIFDPVVDFEMSFDVSPKQKRVGLDLEFNRPPPMQGCLDTPCRMACETFDGLVAGDHEIQLSDAYVSGSISVYVNGVIYNSNKWAEVSASSGSLLVTQTPLATNTITICYLQNCTAEYDCSQTAAHGGETGQPIYYDVFGAHLNSGGGCEWYVPPFLDTDNPTNFCYTPGPSNGLQEQYGEGDAGVGGPGPIQPFGTPNNGNWGVGPTVWSGGYHKSRWTFNFPPQRLCAAYITGFGGMGGTNTTVDYQAGEWDIVDGSFNSGAVVPLVPVVTDTITLYYEYSAPGGLQYFPGIDFRVFMVWGSDG
jgi:hypothetical protein